MASTQILRARNQGGIVCLLEVIKEIYATPAFSNKMGYAPEKHWTDASRKKAVYNEMWTGSQWWAWQVSHPPRIFQCLMLETNELLIRNVYLRAQLLYRT